MAMRGRTQGWLPRWIAVSACVFIMGLAGCESTKQALGIGESAPFAPRYYDFPDVLIPAELEYDAKGSVVYESGPGKYGVLLFSGRVEVESLVDFFKKSMVKDGWTLVSSVRFNRILLAFAKPDKTCQILIWDKTMGTEVEVQMNPTRPST